MNYQQDLKKVMILYPDLEVKSSEDYRDLINIHNVAETALSETPDLKLVETAFNNKEQYKLENLNDYYYLIFKSAMEIRGFKKIAYPNNVDGVDPEIEFDLAKWSGLVYKIYDAVSSGDMKLSEAIDYYAETLDFKSRENEMFKHWIKYYQDGEHLKYSDEKNPTKKVAFQFPLMGPGFYPPENAIVPENPGLERFKEREDLTDNYQEWKNKLHSAIRRIDKLLRQSDDYVEPESQRELTDLLHHFDQEVRTLRHVTTASDLAFNYANRFKKLGFNPGYNEFLKYSQELEQDELGLNEAEQPESEPELNLGDTETEEEDPSAPGPREGEYEVLEGEVNLGDAVHKLEEIAGRLSDRRTIRLLAEFDIILDRIGIAPMFPELAEAQSKLIDGYSYALTRVTKMLGMLSSGKSLVEISDAKKRETTEKTMKEIGKTFNEAGEEEGGERGTPAIQRGLEEKQPTPQQQPAPASPVVPQG